MTQILNRGTDGPRTHAFIVGVGQYRHLPGGSAPTAKVDNWGLGQLTSPPFSAKAFADWVVGELNNPSAPLSTVEMLLSPAQAYQSANGEINHRVEAATMANVEAAFMNWRNACHSHADNVALFYFSGHGIASAHLLLLLEDFAADPLDLFKNALDFDGTHEALARSCQARTQCFFADACRQVTYEAMATVGAGTTFGRADLTAKRAPYGPRFYATLPTTSAYAERAQTSFYTRALLAALGGLGARWRRDRWEVVTDLLQSGIGAAMDHLERDPAIRDQRPSHGGEDEGGYVLHVPKAAPVVPVTIELGPSRAAAAPSKLKVESEAVPTFTKARQVAVGEWQIPLPAGPYRGEVEFPQQEYAVTRHRMYVAPLMHEHYWDVEQPNG